MSSVAAAQSTDSVKQNQAEQDRMKHDRGQDQTKKDDMGKDEMKSKPATASPNVI